MRKLSLQDSVKLERYKRISRLVEDALETAARNTRFGADVSVRDPDWVRVVVRDDSLEIANARDRGIVLGPDLEINWSSGEIELTVLQARPGLEKIFVPALQRELESLALRQKKREMPATNKRGRRKYSDKDQKAAVLDWETFDKSTNPLNLEQWLDSRFGNEGDVLNVPPSTFYGWRTKWLKKLKKKTVDIS